MTNPNATSYRKPYTCEDIIGLLGAYSIGATTPEETRAVEALLPDCPDAMAELAGYMAVSDAMLYMLPMDAEPPADLIGKLNLADAAPVPPPPPTANPNGATQPQTSPPLAVLPPPPSQNPSRSGVWVALAGIAAAVVLVIGMNAVWYTLYRGLQAQQTQITAIIEQQQQLISNIGAAPAAVPAAPLIVMAGNAHSLALQPTTAELDNVTVNVVWDAGTNIGTVYADGLPQPATGHGYQMWLVRGDSEISLGTFTVGTNGMGSLVFQSPIPLQPTDVIGISTEPVNGSLTPTTPHLVTGQVDI